MIRRQLVVTIDDVIWLVLYIIANDCENQQLQNDENIPLNSYFFQQPQADLQDSTDPASKPTEKKTEEETKVTMNDAETTSTEKVISAIGQMEIEKIHFAADIVQKNYIELHKE